MPSVKALVFTGPRSVAVRDVHIEASDPEDVVVRTLFSGISSGTELLAYRGEIAPDLVLDEQIGALGGTFTYPFQYGYACVGEVDGQNVFAFHPHQEQFVISHADLIHLGDINPRQATLFPLVETALQISLDAGPRLGEEVVVLGLGVVGTLTALLLERAGARVVGVDPLAWRRDAAADLGIETVAPDNTPSGVPLVVEVSGRPEALRSALDVLAHEGTALVASWYGSKEVPLPLGGSFHRRRLTIRSTQVSSIPMALAGRWSIERRREATVELLHELPLQALATHTFPVSEASVAFAALDRGREGLLHAALCYE